MSWGFLLLNTAISNNFFRMSALPHRKADFFIFTLWLYLKATWSPQNLSLIAFPFCPVLYGTPLHVGKNMVGQFMRQCTPSLFYLACDWHYLPCCRSCFCGNRIHAPASQNAALGQLALLLFPVSLVLPCKSVLPSYKLFFLSLR